MTSRLHIAFACSMRCTCTRAARASLSTRTLNIEGGSVRGLVGLRVVFGVALFLFRIGHGRAGDFVVAIVVAGVFRILC